MTRQLKRFLTGLEQLAVKTPGGPSFLALDLLRRRWKILVVAIPCLIGLLILGKLTSSNPFPLDPEAIAMTIIIAFVSAAVGLGGGIVALAIAAAGSAFLVNSPGDTRQVTSTVFSVVLWAGVAVTAGLIAGQERSRVARRQLALREALAHSQRTRKQLEQIVSFAPSFRPGASPEEVLEAICVAARQTFGADGARLYTVKGDVLELEALSPTSETIHAGFQVPRADIPDLEELFRERRPTFVHDLRREALGPRADELRQTLGIVSTVRIPLIVSGEVTGLLALNWSHRLERPSEELLALMQRFADQAAIAWESTLRQLAQKRADALYETLKLLVELAPSFHITGSREDVAQAACEAALATFGCTGAALYEVEQDRLVLLERRPPVAVLQRGASFPLGSRTPLARDLRSRVPTFVRDVQSAFEVLGPWPAQVIREAHVRSALYVPLRFDEKGARNLLVLSWDTIQEEPDRDLLAIVERFADQVALALTNAAAEELHARLEAGLLPPTAVEHPDLHVATCYRPGEQRLRLGGDFVGSLPTPDGRLAFVLGDVSGHGPDAAALGTTLRSTWRALALQKHTLKQIAETMEQVLLDEKREPNSFASVLLGSVEPGSNTLELLNAGHPPPVVISADVKTLSTPPQPPLGFGGDRERALNCFRLPERWILFCYTDGLTQARTGTGVPTQTNEGYLLSELRTWQTLSLLPAQNSAVRDSGRRILEEAAEAVVESMRHAAGGRFVDDVAVLVVANKR
ncbi:MAG: SpoIIE family protein phosphatase [Thermoleophilia bacterium]|nr:SpoIIE family protein phosphatase [Thermoleophilia bacterium]